MLGHLNTKKNENEKNLGTQLLCHNYNVVNFK